MARLISTVPFVKGVAADLLLDEQNRTQVVVELPPAIFF